MKITRLSTLILVLPLMSLVITQSLPLETPTINATTNMIIIGQLQMPREETLIVPMNYRSIDPNNFNPFIAQTQLRGPGIVFMCYEYLTNYVFTNNVRYYITTTGYEYNSNFTVFTLYLRNGVKWSDGIPFNATDVEFTFNMTKANSGLTRFRGWLSGVNRTEIVNATTIKFYLNQPNMRYYRNFLGEAVLIMPKHIWANVSDPVAFTNNPPIGTGPYVLLSASSENVVWVRNDNYWGASLFGLPKPKYVVYTWLGAPNGITETAMMKLMKHELEQGRGCTGPQYEMMKGVNPYISVYSTTTPYFPPSPSCWDISVNLDKYPFNYSEVRWAISYALNRQTLVDIAMPGAGQPADSPGWWSPIYAGLNKWKNSTLYAQYNVSEYNPQKSIQLLEGLGFKRGADGIFVTPNGTRLSFLYQSWDGPFDRIVQPLVAQMLKQVGIEVEVKFILSEAYWPIRASGDYDIFRDFQGASDAVDPYYNWAWLSNTQIQPRGVQAGTNRLRWNNTEFSNLLSEMFTLDPVLNETRYYQINNRLSEIWLKELPMIGEVYFADISIVYDTYYWTGWPTKTNFYATGADWYPDFQLVLFKLRPNQPPPAVTASAANAKETSLDVSWGASTTAYFARYEIFQSTAQGVLGTSVANITSKTTTTTTLSGLTPAKLYYSTVRVWNTEGKYADSAQVSIATATPPTPFYMEPWFLASIVVVIVLIIAAVIVLRGKKTPETTA